MRLPVVCFKCYKPTTPPPAGSVHFQEPKDSGVYTFTCSNDHTTIAFLREERFEILYQLAAYAILDGYYREAVASFTASYEGFCEFYLRVMGRKREIPVDQFEVSLNRLVSQSERVLGAYTITYALEHKISPPFIHPEQVKFRNKVVHRGKFPTREEAEAFGQEVADAIYPVLSHLKRHERKHVANVTDARIKQLCRETNEGVQSMVLPGIISINRISPDRHPVLKDCLRELERTRKSRGW